MEGYQKHLVNVNHWASVNKNLNHLQVYNAVGYTCCSCAFLLVCRRVRGTTRQRGGSVSQVSRGEWPERRLYQKGLGEERGGEMGKNAVRPLNIPP